MSFLHSIMFVVIELEKAVAFFRNVLDFMEVEFFEEKGPSFDNLYKLKNVHVKHVRLKLGNQEVCLSQFMSHTGKVFPPDSESSDLWFQHIAIVVSDMEQAYKKLMDEKVLAISHTPQTIPEWNKAAAGIKAFYFRSPHHHPLEIIYFPDDKGLKEWHVRKRLFLGIDHTALAVADTERSIRFYQNLFDLETCGTSLNYGETQEKLTSVPGARVKITTLRDKKGKGIGVEFLQYLEGKKGRRLERQYHDVAATKMVFKTEHFNEVLDKLKNDSVPFSKTHSGEVKQALFQDPDGHTILLQSGT